MASNFKINRSRQWDDLHLRLTGDFDGTSAFELFYAIKEGVSLFNSIYIHTDSLSSMLPFGRDAFVTNYALAGLSADKLRFTGKFAVYLTPHPSEEIAV